VHTSLQQLATALQSLQSVSTVHSALMGQGVWDSLQAPLTQITLGHDVEPSEQTVHSVTGWGQSASLVHCGVGQVGYVIWHSPLTQVLVAHRMVPS